MLGVALGILGVSIRGVGMPLRCPRGVERYPWGILWSSDALGSSLADPLGYSPEMFLEVWSGILGISVGVLGYFCYIPGVALGDLVGSFWWIPGISLV